MKTLDASTLTEIIKTCFTLAMDARVPLAKQRQLLAAGKRLRGDLVSMLTAQFDDSTTELDAANNDLAATNAVVQQSVNDLGKIDEVLKKITSVVDKVDKLIPLIAKAI